MTSTGKMAGSGSPTETTSLASMYLNEASEAMNQPAQSGTSRQNGTERRIAIKGCDTRSQVGRYSSE